MDENGLESGREVLAGLADECSAENRDASCKKILKVSVDYAGYSYSGMKAVLVKDYAVFLGMAYAVMYRNLFTKNNESILNQLKSDILLQI